MALRATQRRFDAHAIPTDCGIIHDAEGVRKLVWHTAVFHDHPQQVILVGRRRYAYTGKPMSKGRGIFTSLRTLTPADKAEILERDCYTCVYCGDIATVVDHVVPWSWSHCDDRDNLVASCELCNHIASNKIFPSINEKCAFIKTQRKRRKFVNREKRNIALCAWCKNNFKQGVRGASNVLCADCYKISKVGGNPYPETGRLAQAEIHEKGTTKGTWQR